MQQKMSVNLFSMHNVVFLAYIHCYTYIVAVFYAMHKRRSMFFKQKCLVFLTENSQTKLLTCICT